MFKSFAGARLGIFLFLGTILMILMLFVVGNKESLFTQSIEIKTFFRNVNTLKSGAPVMLSGYQIGSVSSINLMPDSLGLVEVKMKINYDAQNFIRLDSKAIIETKGFIGQKYISISPGKREYEVIKNGGTIVAEEPLDVQQMIVQTTEIMDFTKKITEDFAEIVNKVNEGKGTIGLLVNDSRLYNASVRVVQSGDSSLSKITENLNVVAEMVTNLGANLNGILSNVDTTSKNINQLIQNIRDGKGAIGKLVADKSVEDSVSTIITNLTSSVRQLEITSNRFAENMEALKHNWLFKDYFETRGYWDYDSYKKEIDTKILELEKKIRELKELEENFKANNSQKK